MNKRPYSTPTIKVVEFHSEIGYASSCFNRTAGEQFEMDLINGETRGEQFIVESWDQTSSQDGTHFRQTDWGTL